jgi:signal transduction histidine kinase
VDRNVRAQTRLIEDLLDVSRIVSGKMTLETRPVRPAEVVSAAVEVVRPAAEAKGVALAVETPLAAGFVAGDPDRLQQVAWNLLSSAVKFTPAGGRVTVALRAAAGRMVLTVADTGEGIDRDFLPFVFDRFRQADGSTTRRHGGLGLGLAIVRQVTELHGGDGVGRQPRPRARGGLQGGPADDRRTRPTRRRGGAGAVGSAAGRPAGAGRG